MLPQDGWLCWFVWCRACYHQAPANLQAIIDGGRGDVPLKDLKFRCTSCSSRRTYAVDDGQGRGSRAAMAVWGRVEQGNPGYHRPAGV